MARKQKPKPTPGRRLALAGAALLAAALLAVTVWAAICANTVYVRRATVTVPDLPPSFEGVTLLYASDIDLCGRNTPAKVIDLFKTLQALRPDMLVLGGDYASDTLFEQLNSGDAGGNPLRRANDITTFLRGLASFEAPLGKYAIATPDDGNRQALSERMTQCGITPVFNACVTIRSGGRENALRLCDASTGSDFSSYHLRASDCVIAVAATPDAFPRLMTLEAPGGGPLIDLALAGHTHGGQILLFGHSVLTLTSHEYSYLYGWKRETGVPMLTTSGLGCEGVNLRLGSTPEVWLIALTAK